MHSTRIGDLHRQVAYQLTEVRSQLNHDICLRPLSVRVVAGIFGAAVKGIPPACYLTVHPARYCHRGAFSAEVRRQ